MKTFTGACDNKVRFFDLPSQKETLVGSHEFAVKTVHFHPNFNILLTGSWDKTIKFWDFKSNNPCSTINLADRVYATCMKDNFLAVATGNHRISVYDVRNQQNALKVAVFFL